MELSPYIISLQKSLQSIAAPAGQEVEFVVDELDRLQAASAPPESSESQSSDDVARVTLRLPESLKDSIEQAANFQGISVNDWFLSAISSAASAEGDHGQKPRDLAGAIEVTEVFPVLEMFYLFDPRDNLRAV
jgi:predicted HicB family RNase H-like nuclease